MATNKQGHKAIHVAYPIDDLPALKQHCIDNRTNVSDFARVAIQRAMTDQRPSNIPTGPDVYAKAVEAAARASSGLPRTQLEALVAATIVSLHESAL